MVRGHVAQTNEPVAGSHRIGPAQLIHSQSDCALRVVQCLHKLSHGHRRGVPAAGNESFKNRSLRTLTAEMKHLWIKLVGKLDELPLRYSQRLRLEPITHF